MSTENKELLGDKVEKILKSIGGNKVAEIIEKVGRRPCGCGGRKDKLNEWHRKVLKAYEDMTGKQ